MLILVASKLHRYFWWHAFGER